jgi:hypothetical protein
VRVPGRSRSPAEPAWPYGCRVRGKESSENRPRLAEGQFEDVLARIDELKTAVDAHPHDGTAEVIW